MKKHVFWVSPAKTMQNHLEISSKNHFWTRNVRNWTKSRDLDMSDLPRPVQEDKYLLQTSGNTFIFSEITPFHFLLANLSGFYEIISFTKQVYLFIKSSVLLRKLISFWGIIGFTKRIYHFYKIIVLLREFIISIKNHWFYLANL